MPCASYAPNVLDSRDKVMCQQPVAAVVSYKCDAEHERHGIEWCLDHLRRAQQNLVACARCAETGQVNPVNVFDIHELEVSDAVPVQASSTITPSGLHVATGWVGNQG